MKITELTPRLQYISSFITPTYILADIGTDHGFVPIHQVMCKGTPKAYAMDVNKGPLERANEHIIENGLADKIETRLSDGLEKLAAGEAESILIAGMGGELMVRILTDGTQALSTAKELVLSPHTEADAVRNFIRESDFVIDREGMVYDAGKYYVVMHARRVMNDDEMNMMYADGNNNTAENEGLWSVQDIKRAYIRYGKYLIKEKSEVFMEFLQKEQNTYKKIAEGLKDNETEAGQQRLEQVEDLIKLTAIGLEI